MAGAQGLFQLCVLRLGFLQDGYVGVGVFALFGSLRSRATPARRQARHGLNSAIQMLPVRSPMLNTILPPATSSPRRSVGSIDSRAL
jgi:hypothetical protein